MKRRKFLLVCALGLLVVGLVVYKVWAVGMVTELPFSGTYNVSCGYHTSCASTPTPGYGLDFVNASESTYGDVAYASGRGTVTAAGADGGWGNRVLIRHPDNYYSRYAHLQYWFPAVRGHIE
jgi:murein DD-endopeptidase MepM/ murein hydrolase activator NlpD